jgi:hypothetical protein
MIAAVAGAAQYTKYFTLQSVGDYLYALRLAGSKHLRVGASLAAFNRGLMIKIKSVLV